MLSVIAPWHEVGMHFRNAPVLRGIVTIQKPMVYRNDHVAVGVTMQTAAPGMLLSDTRLRCPAMPAEMRLRVTHATPARARTRQEIRNVVPCPPTRR